MCSYEHWKKSFEIFKRHKNIGIWYLNDKLVVLKGFVDSDCAGCIDDMKSSPGYIFYLGFGPIC